MTVIYLASAIDQAQDSDEEYHHRTSVRDLANKICGWGFPVYTPAHAWKTPGRHGESLAIDSVNRAALSRADILVAYLPGGVASIGVPTEIEAHTAAGKTAIVIGQFNSVVLDANPRVRRLRSVFDWNATLKALQLVIEEVSLEVPSPSVTRPPNFYRSGFPELPDPVDYALEAYNQFTQPVQTRTLMYRSLGEREEVPPQAMSRAFTDDAGLDLVTAEDVTVRQGEYHNIRCGYAIALPDDVFGWVVARSSTFTRWGAMVLPGIIDPGYRGEMCVACFFPHGEVWPTAERTVPAGTRLAQLVILPNTTRRFGVMQVDEFGAKPDAQVRGNAGWGSSGE